MPTLHIKSVNLGNTLALEPDGPDYVRATLRGPHLSAEVRAYLYEDASSLAQFFIDMALDWKGWMGEKVWCSAEDELRLTATVDVAGHVTIAVAMNGGQGPDPWSAEIALQTEAGQLDELSRRAKVLFG